MAKLLQTKPKLPVSPHLMKEREIHVSCNFKLNFQQSFWQSQDTIKIKNQQSSTLTITMANLFTSPLLQKRRKLIQMANSAQICSKNSQSYDATKKGIKNQPHSLPFRGKTSFNQVSSSISPLLMKKGWNNTDGEIELIFKKWPN